MSSSRSCAGESAKAAIARAGSQGRLQGRTAKLIDVYPPSAWYTPGYALNLTDSIVRLRYRNGWERGSWSSRASTLTLYPTSNLFMSGQRSAWTCRARTSRGPT
jgi:hypothetical protein